MVKIYALTLGCCLALSLAACTPPAAQQPQAETPQAQQVKPGTPETQTRDGRSRQNPDGARRVPPEIAYAACADLAAEAACSFETPRGTRNGICQTREGDDRTVCFVKRPEGGRRGPGGQRSDRPRPTGE